MREWIDRVLLFVRVQRAVWRERRVPTSLADTAAALDEALARFPADRVHQVARAQADLALRELFGVRKFDS